MFGSKSKIFLLCLNKVIRLGIGIIISMARWDRKPVKPLRNISFKCIPAFGNTKIPQRKNYLDFSASMIIAGSVHTYIRV